MERDILLLGNPRLYEISEEVKREELEELRSVFTDMFDCIRGIRRDYGFGRAIAAPQIGVQKRLICILTDQKKPYRRPKKSIASTVSVLPGMFCMIRKTPMNASMIHGWLHGILYHPENRQFCLLFLEK